MIKQGYLFVLILLIFLFSCSRKKNLLQPKVPKESIPSTMPQTDIPWPSLADSPWPMSSVDPQGIARSKYEGPIDGKVVWSIKLWQIKANIGGPAIGPDGTIYVSGMLGNLFAISPKGKIKWHFKGSINTGAVVGKDSTIYAGGYGIYALQPNGKVKWHNKNGFFTTRRILLGIDGAIYANSEFSGIIYAFTPDGKLKWQNNCGDRQGISYLSASPDGATLYVPGKDSTLIALDAETGVEKWSYKMHTCFNSGPSVDSQGNIYFYDKDAHHNGYICSVTPLGNIRWKYRVNSVGSEPPWAGINIDRNGNIYFFWIYLTILDYGGNLKYKIQIPDYGSTTSPVIIDKDNHIFFLGVKHPRVFCYEADGILQYLMSVPGNPYSGLFPGAIGKNGEMYLTANSPYVVAIR